MGAVTDMPQEGLVVKATKPGLATRMLPTVLKSDRSPISAEIYLAEKKEENVNKLSTPGKGEGIYMAGHRVGRPRNIFWKLVV